MHPQLAARRLDVLHTQLESQRLDLLSCLNTLDGQLYQLRQTLGSEEYSRIMSLINRMRGEADALGAGSQISALALQELGKQLCRVTLALAKANPPQEESAAIS
ncbi:hypothetical protein SAE02_78750 [Skermanella aerolata]|uniref:Uncharacterized protein n=1 Tax=Skermanella aerolata TaxID=393310 RepID=A0A512E4S8_9PROT|nr:hypothetical protein [Skermanella aerolata]KJB90421.1 hypothetical protein N826_41320 [Skermanella aerolata KACC 11604]GEO43727.1 hypothetical protein SAE02_78750 [Skermanella aerolata]